ncbi:hypothetical protein A3D73_02795 [Candidatus Uhrbacteria bacterium RIFCSPHIGHO2_02_FULL_60_44]|nr:MAG: hypothetical protein A3D73_02795 [Candidatus Uhrbacteria bacterium RIFCSPHIGHO2_02_FULL_60_44]
MDYKRLADQLLEASSRHASLFLNRVVRSWSAVLSGAVLLLAISVAFLWFALREPAAVVSNGPFVAPTLATSTGDLAPRALDGVLVHPSSTNLLPIGVMVENSSDAWPLQGPARADLVFEAPVEGSITRYLLFIDASTTVDEIGPVRSARPYFVEWAEGLKAMYAHVGGSPASLDLIASKKDFRDLNEYWNGWAFWRSPRRAAPHNVFTKSDLLVRAANRKSYEPGDFTHWFFREFPTSTREGAVVDRITVPYDGAYRASWVYDDVTNDYVRYRNGDTLTDADGTEVRVKNVVVILTDATVLDDIGRLKLRTTGSGKALVFHDGEKKEATWSRSAGEHIRFFTVDGLDVPFARGKTWISVITNAAVFDTVSP